jgi:hypothetical protein
VVVVVQILFRSLRVIADVQQEALDPHRVDHVRDGLSHRMGIALGFGFSFALALMHSDAADLIAP